MSPSAYVTCLHYVVDTEYIYDPKRVVEFSAESANFTLQGSELAITFQNKPQSISEARKQIEPTLRSWEFEDWIYFGFSDARFAFKMGEGFGNIKPEPPEELIHVASSESRLIIALNHFPEPPQITLTKEMSGAWERWQRAQLGFGEPLQSTAYFVLTLLENRAGSRKKASELVRIEMRILRKIGELTSTTGSLRTARKAYPGLGRELTWKEINWLKLTIRHILMNMGLYENGRPIEEVKMSDLPSLD